MPKSILILTFLLFLSKLNAQTVYSITVIGNDDKTRVSDNENFNLVSKDVATNLGLPLKSILLNGSKFTIKNTKETLQRLVIAPTDIVMFYYSGKGSMEEKGVLPQFFFPEGDLPMRDISGILKSKKPKLLLIIGDCDQKDYYPDVNLKSLAVLHPAPENENFKTLFNGFKGRMFVQISSTTPGQTAKRDKKHGSLFLREFKRSFEEETSGETPQASWNHIKENTTKRLQAVTNNTQKPKFMVEVFADVEEE